MHGDPTRTIVHDHPPPTGGARAPAAPAPVVAASSSSASPQRPPSSRRSRSRQWHRPARPALPTCRTSARSTSSRRRCRATATRTPTGWPTCPFSIGALVRGDTLVSNFNASSNLQGTGTTIVQVAPTGQVSLFAQINPQLARMPRRGRAHDRAQRPRRRLRGRRQPAGHRSGQRHTRGGLPHRPEQQRRAGRDVGRQRHQRSLGHDGAAVLLPRRPALRDQRAERHRRRRTATRWTRAPCCG